MENQQVYLKVSNNNNSSKTIPTLTLEGVSRAGVGTCIRVKEFGWLLDCGGGLSEIFYGCSNVFISHCHLDHCVLAPLLSHMRPSKSAPQIQFHVPNESVESFTLFLKSSELLDSKPNPNSSSTTSTSSPTIQTTKPPYKIIGHNPGDEFLIDSNHFVKIIRTEHEVVPSIGFAFYSIKKVLKQEFIGKTSDEISELIKTKKIVPTDTIRNPMFVYLGDTKSTIFEHEQLLITETFPIIITESTFIGYHQHHKKLSNDINENEEDKQRKEEEKTKTKGHSSWNELFPFIQSHQNTTFVLTHFSLKHSYNEIHSFFASQKLQNVIPFIPNSTTTIQSSSSNSHLPTTPTTTFSAAP